DREALPGVPDGRHSALVGRVLLGIVAGLADEPREDRRGNGEAEHDHAEDEEGDVVGHGQAVADSLASDLSALRPPLYVGGERGDYSGSINGVSNALDASGRLESRPRTTG